jgi:hypothetical protein
MVLEAFAALQLAAGVWRQQSWRILGGGLLGVAALAVRGQHTWFMDSNGFYPLHLALLLVIVVAVFFDDATARAIRRHSWLIVPIAAVVAAVFYDWLFPGVPATVQACYLVALVAFSIYCWFTFRRVPQLLCAIASLSASAFGEARHLYLMLGASELGRALPFLAWGITFLVFGGMVSFWKGGIGHQLWNWLERMNGRLSRTRSPPA